MKPRLYLETTIPSYLVARPSQNLRLAADQQATREWWDTQRHNYDLYTSETVRAEAERGDTEAAAERLALLQNIPTLAKTRPIDDLASEIIATGLIPARAALDAAHISFATVHQLDYLLTWNCRHIHNVTIIRRVERLCERLGYTCPIICTPNDLLET